MNRALIPSPSPQVEKGGRKKNIMSQTLEYELYIVAIMDLSFSFLPVEGKKRITLVRFILCAALCSMCLSGSKRLSKVIKVQVSDTTMLKREQMRSTKNSLKFKRIRNQ